MANIPRVARRDCKLSRYLRGVSAFCKSGAHRQHGFCRKRALTVVFDLQLDALSLALCRVVADRAPINVIGAIVRWISVFPYFRHVDIPLSLEYDCVTT